MTPSQMNLDAHRHSDSPRSAVPAVDLPAGPLYKQPLTETEASQ
jgi:hypothetical protein